MKQTDTRKDILAFTFRNMSIYHSKIIWESQKHDKDWGQGCVVVAVESVPEGLSTDVFWSVGSALGHDLDFDTVASVVLPLT